MTEITRRSIRRYYLYQGLTNFSLWLPIWVVYLQRLRGLSLTQVTLIDAVFWITITASEVPTGSVADTVGRKASLALSAAIQMAAALLYGLAPNFSLLIVAYVLWGIGLSFSSGALEAFLFDTLQNAGMGETYPHYTGRGRAISEGAAIAASLAGSWIAGFNLAWPFLGMALVFFGALVVSLGMHEPVHTGIGPAAPPTAYRDTLKHAYQTIRSAPVLIYMMIYSALLSVVTVVVTVTLMQPQALAIGFEIPQLGLLVVWIKSGSLAGSLAAGAVAGTIGYRNSLLIAPLVILIVVIGLGISHSRWSVLLYAPATFFISAQRPLLENLVQRKVTSNVRATILSVQSLVFTLLLAGLQPFIGFLADHLGIFNVYFILSTGFALAILSALLLWFRLEPVPHRIPSGAHPN